MSTKEPKSTVQNRYPKNFPIPPDKLSKVKLDLILKQELTEWKVVRSSLPENPFVEREELFREYVFRDFNEVLEYMGRVAVICNMLPHHPRWENTWTTLKVYLTTWDSVYIVTYKDIMLARHMEQIYRDYDNSYFNAHAGARITKDRKDFFREIEDLKNTGDLEQAFHKLSQFIAQPEESASRALIAAQINDFNEFIKATRLKQLSRAEISSKTSAFAASLEQIIEASVQKPKVFFSYAWGQEKEKIVDELYESLKKDKTYELLRDKVDLGYKELISGFMKTIGRGSFVIIVLSEKYLKSEYCMFELYELYRNSSLDKESLLKKIYPIRLEQLDLDDLGSLAAYSDYWETQLEQIEKLATRFPERYQKIKNINNELGPLLELLRDINAQTVDMLSRNDFATIKSAIKERAEEVRVSG